MGGNELLNEAHGIRRARSSGYPNHNRRCRRHLSIRSANTKPRKTMLMTPFIVKNAASSRVKSSGFTSEINRRCPRAETGRSECDNSRYVQAPCDEQRGALTERSRHRVQSILSIEADVLKCVENVEPTDPGCHSGGECDEHPPRVAPRPGNCQIAANGCDRQT